MRWKNLFASQILDRGYYYYEDNCIEGFACNDGKYNQQLLEVTNIMLLSKSKMMKLLRCSALVRTLKMAANVSTWQLCFIDWKVADL